MGMLRFRTAPFALPGGGPSQQPAGDPRTADTAIGKALSLQDTADSLTAWADGAAGKDAEDPGKAGDSSHVLHDDVADERADAPGSRSGDTEIHGAVAGLSDALRRDGQAAAEGAAGVDGPTMSNWASALTRAYITGYDGRVFPTTVTLDHYGDEPLLVCRRPVTDSGKLRVPWPVKGRGLQVLSTSSLRERDEPYELAVELARGLLGELRNQAAAWRQGGMVLPDSYRERADAAFGWFTQAACRVVDDAGEAASLAQRAIEEGCQASDELMRAYTVQKLASYDARRGTLPVVLGCGLEQPPVGSSSLGGSGEADTDLIELDSTPSGAFLDAFNAASIPMSWPRVEPVEGQADWSAVDPLVDWAESHGLLMQAGPLLDFRGSGLPRWLKAWSVDQASFQSFLCDYVEVAKSRYRGRIKFWSLAIGACTGGGFDLSEEQRLTLVARLLEAARGSDDDSQVFLEIDQPWGEYQADGQHRIAPLQFVDAIARSNLGLDGITLQIDLTPAGRLTRYRLLTDYSRLVDHWSLFGLPLHLRLVVPSTAADFDAARWLGEHLPLMMAKPSVTAVFWSRFEDAPNDPTGVLRVGGDRKPVHGVFVSQRRRAQV